MTDPLPQPPDDVAALEAHLQHLFRHAGEHPAAHRLRALILQYRLAQAAAARPAADAEARP